MRHVITAAVLAFVTIMRVWEINAINDRIDDLEKRVTTFETVRIEYVAPSADGG